MPTFKNLTLAVLTYQRPQALKKCLESISLQTHQPNKILVIDSFKLKKNIPECRNLAIKKCQTKYLAFVDDDCILDKHWVKNAYDSIKTSPTSTFIVGKSLLLNKQNLVARVQYQNYLRWFKTTRTLDTKNLILNLSLLKDIRFDPKLKIFEDVDLGLQLKLRHQVGNYNPKMVVYHPEVDTIFGAIKKNFIRGQYKANITRKWGEYDGYSTTIPSYINLPDFVLKLSFLLGYLKNFPRPIHIVNYDDHGANSKRLTKVREFLTTRHYFVKTIDSHAEFQKVIASRRYLLVYGLPLLKYRFLKSYYESRQLDIVPRLLPLTMILKSKIIDRILRKNRTTLAIIQNPEDMLVANIPHRPYQTLYDSPTLFFRELDLNDRYFKKTVSWIKSAETRVYLNSDFVSFHWYTYFQLARFYGLEVSHPLTLNWGCDDVTSVAKFSSKTKIIHLGKLNSYWVNPELLTAISRSSKVDIFSYEKPDPSLYQKLSGYKGFLPDEQTISDYQLGLITLSKDDLRSSGFSAKYLLYLSYGLPVLCPAWRHDPLLSSATIYYNETNIKEILEKYRDPLLWQKKHLAAIELSKKLSWNNNLSNLLKIIHE